jgi:hypothetical protein
VTKGYLTEEARARLRYVRVRPGRVSLARFPDFFVIGPQRTGTTWIHENLRDHPDILWPRRKEIFFFSRLDSPEHPKFESADIDWYLEQFRDPLWMLPIKMALSLRRTRAPYRPCVIGEATASYAAMDPDLIDEVVTLNPRLRAIMMIRNPIDRAWSHAKKDLVRNRGRKFEEVSEREFEEFFRDPYQLRCARYAENIDNWSRRLESGKLFLGRFEDVSARPAELLGDICRFLGVRSERRFLGAAVERTVNPTANEPIPARYRSVLETLLARDLEKLRERFGLTWLTPAETSSSSRPPD